MSENRRRQERVALEWPARIGRRGLGVAAALVKDASLGGAYLETTLEIDAGDKVLLELQVAEGTKILAEGRIVRVASPRARVFGYGIQFIRLEDEAMEIYWQSYRCALRAPGPPTSQTHESSSRFNRQRCHGQCASAIAV